MAIRACQDSRRMEGATTSGGGEGGVGSKAKKGKRPAVVVAAAAGTTIVVGGETTLCFLITRVPGEVFLESGATMRTSLIIAILTGLVQSTAICLYPWHLLHLAMVLILKIFFLVPLFLLSISTFLPLTSFLGGSGRVLDL